MPGRRILVVDDDREFLEELTETLNLSGYEVNSVSESGRAVGLAAKFRPDLILLDLKMAGMTGFEVAEKLRLLPQTAGIPIIAISAFFNESRDCTVLDFFQIKRCLQKPFNPLDVIANIETTLKDADISS
ncbi:MAG: response regulator [Candidatus Omnitrophica bacterium]|jgi:CheY-like chemotaxis protein|nr:response regulator [Candidatus Omnitrophota bacterium]